MKRSVFLVLIFFMFSCSDDKNESVCNVENPLEDLEWLRDEIEADRFSHPSTFSDSFVYQAKYIGQPVFYISTCCPSCNVAPPSVRACNGDVLGSLGVDIDPDDLVNQKLLLRTNNGVCP